MDGYKHAIGALLPDKKKTLISIIEQIWWIPELARIKKAKGKVHPRTGHEGPEK
jgi:hypothetical protein